MKRKHTKYINKSMHNETGPV